MSNSWMSCQTLRAADKQRGEFGRDERHSPKPRGRRPMRGSRVALCLAGLLMITEGAAPAAATLLPTTSPPLPVGLTANAAVGVGTGSEIFVPATNIGIVLDSGAPQLGLTVAVGPTLADGPLVGNQQILSGLGEPLVASATFAVSPAPTGETFSGTAKATGAFGGLGVSAKDTYSCPGVTNCNPGSASDMAFAYATFTDLLTIPPLVVGCPSPFGCGPGAPGTLLLSFDVSGVASGVHLPFNGGGDADLDVAVNIGGRLFE